MKKLKLNTLERLLMSAKFLLQQGGFIQMLTAEGIKGKVKFSPEELDELELKDNPNGSVSWNYSKDREVEYEFTDSEVSILKKSMEELDQNKQITNDILSICIKVDKL
ncbi:hypothetical protein [Albibacterium profundi]|uniref:Uncharacterized protein n=1 Tax=Albibacterium profundi TaxID=3134906 RepID=A0ABV5CF51_9SPHI